MEIRLARSSEEVEAALDLSCRSFPLGYFEARSLKEALRQFLPTDFAIERFIVAVDSDKVVAVLRHYPRLVKIGGIDIEILGLSDYCVDERVVKKPIFGVKFYLKCCQILRQSEYPFALGSARRKMSNYYYRFGHVGCDSYCQCRIEKLKLVANGVERMNFVEAFKEDNIDTYESFRQRAFSSEWGMVVRSNGFWRWIGYQIKSLKKYRMFEVNENDVLVGYFIVSEDHLIDFGIKSEAYVGAVVAFLSEVIARDHLVLNLSPSNVLFQTLGMSHICYSMRYVPDEGIIALGLNREKLVEVFCTIMAVAGRQFETRSLNFALSENLAFNWDDERLIPAFRPEKMQRKDEQLLLNALFMGTYGPFSLLNYLGPRVFPPTFFRFNDLDVM